MIGITRDSTVVKSNLTFDFDTEKLDLAEGSSGTRKITYQTKSEELERGRASSSSLLRVCRAWQSAVDGLKLYPIRKTVVVAVRMFLSDQVLLF